MDLSTVANVATALTVITGVGFGLVEGAAIATCAARACGLRGGPGAFVAGMDEVDDRRAQYPGWF